MANYRILSSFHSTLDNIVKERLSETFHLSCDEPAQMKSPPLDNRLPDTDTDLLTMGMIGCLPDNVQQAIKSFSIRRGKQHVTFAFPFMEDSLRTFCHNPCDLGQHSTSRSFSSGLFFDECLEVVHGFKTYITFVPHINRHTLPVVLLTLYQRGTTEGIFCHFRSLFRIFLHNRPSSFLSMLPTLVADLNVKLREKILDTSAETILEIHHEFLMQSFGHTCKSNEELLTTIKNRLLRPNIVPYRELLRRNIQEVMKQLTTTDPAYFVSVLDLLQAPGCSVLDLKKVDMMFKNPCSEQIVKDFWQIWGHEQIAWKVFTGIRSSETSPKTNHSLLYSTLVGVGCEQTISVGPISHVPLKEGLQSVIKCLKSQEMTCTSESRREIKLGPCCCGICKVQFCTSRSRVHGMPESAFETPDSPKGSAFTMPLKSKSFFLNEKKNLRFSPPYPCSPIPYCHTTSVCRSGDTESTSFIKERQTLHSSSSSFSETLNLAPLSPYFKMNLKPTVQSPFMYGYSLSATINSFGNN